MIPVDNFIQNSRKWLGPVSHKALPSPGDAMTVFLVQLRIIGSDMLDLVGGNKPRREMPTVSVQKSRLNMLVKRRQEWDSEVQQLGGSTFKFCT